jgi:hypothetical protein
MTSIPGKSFLIVTPCDDGHKLCFWDSLRAFEKAYYSGSLNTPHRFDTLTPPGDSLVPRARNNIAAAAFLQTTADYQFSIDSDLDFRVEDILRMADIAAGNDLAMLAALYAIKQDELRWCINSLPNVPPNATTGLQEIAMAPGGLNITHRRVFEAMIAAAPTWTHWPVAYTDDAAKDTRWNFYYNGVVRDAAEWPDKPHGRYLSEDWGFSYFARKLGFKIWLDTKTVMLHRGECFYPKQARRLTQEEVASGNINQPDGTQTPIVPAEKV